MVRGAERIPHISFETWSVSASHRRTLRQRNDSRVFEDSDIDTDDLLIHNPNNISFERLLHTGALGSSECQTTNSDLKCWKYRQAEWNKEWKLPVSALPKSDEFIFLHVSNF